MPAIEIESVSKRYILGGQSHPTLGGLVAKAGRWSRHALSELSQGRLPGARVDAPPPVLWALRDVSFAVQPGEVVGIVGRNGNGKSTLLKILSRITMPTSGRVRIKGSVSSLLEIAKGLPPGPPGGETIF